MVNILIIYYKKTNFIFNCDPMIKQVRYLFYSRLWWGCPKSPVVGGGCQKCPYQNTHLTLTCDTAAAELRCTAGHCCGDKGWCVMASGMDWTWSCPRQYWLAEEEAPSLWVHTPLLQHPLHSLTITSEELLCFKMLSVFFIFWENCFCIKAPYQSIFDSSHSKCLKLL